MDNTHPGLNTTTNFIYNLKSNKVKKLLSDGYIILENAIDEEECQILIRDLNLLRGKYPYHMEENNNYAGVFRSPFIFFESYRDLMLSPKFHDILLEIFPTNYQLHLSRCVENKKLKSAATIEWHRDIPYLHTPSKFPLSISFLTFLSSSDQIQLEIKLESHNDFFYDFEQAEVLSLNPNPGDTLVFDSNLIHRTLATNKTVLYNLFMFTNPVLKPVVDYTSKEIINKINSNKYRIEEVNKILGYQYGVSKDDLEYINKKL